jgi:pimeloyl-ACP methyl ester carboxylesterase
MTITIRNIQANGMTFRCREAGDSGEPVILLHGFPETSHMWTKLMPRLAASGYRCLAPDQRGYSAGARPEGIPNYATDLLVSDVIALADAWGAGERFHLVAHDWGAGVGWRVVAAHPERIASWTSLSIPHPASYGRAFREDPEQQEKSQYILFFQEPGAAEAALSANDWAMLRSIWDKSGAEEVAEYVATFTRPGAMTAALNWYRASFGGGTLAEARGSEFKVALPTLTIWGNQDSAVGRGTTTTQAQYMTGYNRFVEMEAGHWLVQEKFEDVASELLAHLKKFPAI